MSESALLPMESFPEQKRFQMVCSPHSKNQGVEVNDVIVTNEISQLAPVRLKISPKLDLIYGFGN